MRQKRTLDVHSVYKQQDLDEVPADYGGLILIFGGTEKHPIRLRTRFQKRPLAKPGSVVSVGGHAWIRFLRGSRGWAAEKSDAIVEEDAFVIATDRAHLRVLGDAKVWMRDRSSACVFHEGTAFLDDDARADVRGSGTALAFGNSHAYLHQKSIGYRMENGSAYAMEPTAKVMSRAKRDR